MRARFAIKTIPLKEERICRRRRAPIRIVIGLGWFGFFTLAGGATLFAFMWQGFSPDGPPEGFKPEPLHLFFLKNYWMIFAGLFVKLWGVSLTLSALTILEVWRARTLANDV